MPVGLSLFGPPVAPIWPSMPAPADRGALPLTEEPALSGADNADSRCSNAACFASPAVSRFFVASAPLAQLVAVSWDCRSPISPKRRSCTAADSSGAKNRCACGLASDPSRDGGHRQRTQVGAAAAFASAPSAALGAAMAFFVGCGTANQFDPTIVAPTMVSDRGLLTTFFLQTLKKRPGPPYVQTANIL